MLGKESLKDICSIAEIHSSIFYYIFFFLPQMESRIQVSRVDNRVQDLPGVRHKLEDLRLPVKTEGRGTDHERYRIGPVNTKETNKTLNQFNDHIFKNLLITRSP